MPRDLSVEIVENLSSIESEWNALLPASYSYLDTRYLEVLQSYPPQGYEVRFSAFRKDGRLVGVGVLQFVYFKLEERLKHAFGPDWLKSWLNGWLVNFGNLTVTGSRHFYFDEPITDVEKTAFLKELICSSYKYRPDGNKRPVMFLLKEAARNGEDQKWIDASRLGLRRNQVQPAMIFEVDNTWESFDDYLYALKSKYRMAFRRYQSKGRSLRSQEMNLEDVTTYEKEIYSLYIHMAAAAGFNGFELHPEYFTQMKKALGEDFKVYGIWHEGVLVAFYSLWIEEESLDAHFIGVSKTLRQNVYLYNNLLLSMIKVLFDLKKKKLYFGRTALESKSALGAQPKQYVLYLRHVNPILNLLVGPVFRLFYPGEKWKVRHPFRKGVISSEPRLH